MPVPHNMLYYGKVKNSHGTVAHARSLPCSGSRQKHITTLRTWMSARLRFPQSAGRLAGALTCVRSCTAVSSASGILPSSKVTKRPQIAASASLLLAAVWVWITTSKITQRNMAQRSGNRAASRMSVQQ